MNFANSGAKGLSKRVGEEAVVVTEVARGLTI